MRKSVAFPLFALFILIFSAIPVESHHRILYWENQEIEVVDGGAVRSTIYGLGEGRSRKEMFACALWWEAMQPRWREGKSSEGRCENFPTDSFVILRIQHYDRAYAENAYYIDYTGVSNVKPRRR